MTEWEPATEAEAAMRDALRVSDQEQYFRILARTDLLLPVYTNSLAGRTPMGWGTWNSGGRTHVLAFTSVDSMRLCLAEHAGSARKIPYDELATRVAQPRLVARGQPGPADRGVPAAVVRRPARPRRRPAARASQGTCDRCCHAAADTAAADTAATSSTVTATAARPPRQLSRRDPTDRDDIRHRSGPEPSEPPTATRRPRRARPPAAVERSPPTPHLRSSKTQRSSSIGRRRASSASPRRVPEWAPRPQASPARCGDHRCRDHRVDGARAHRAGRDGCERDRCRVSRGRRGDRRRGDRCDRGRWRVAAGRRHATARRRATGRHAPPGRHPGRRSRRAEAGAAIHGDAPKPAPFVPANDVEENLLDAVSSGKTDNFLSTLLLAKVLIPIPTGESSDVRPDNPAFPWRREVVDGQPYLVVFTSPERMREFMGAGATTVTAKFVQLIRHWPDVNWALRSTRASPVGATLPGAQIKALSVVGGGCRPDR